MKRLVKLLFLPLLFCTTLITGLPYVYADCINNAGDAALAFLSGGLSVAACETQELVDAIKNFINTVSALATNVANNAKAVADAAVGAIKSAADDITGTITNAQRDLSNAASEAKTMASIIPLTASVNQTMPHANTTMSNHNAVSTRTRAGSLTATQGGARPRPNAQASAPMQLAADPQRLHSALVRGSQELASLKSSVDQDIAGRINGALQRARNQASMHLSDATNIVQTALLAPINALLNMLNDLVSNPSRLLDPIATINTMVDDITKNVVETMNHINDVITKDAIATLGSVEADVQQVQGASQEGTKLLAAMRKAHQQKTQSALQQLESLLNANEAKGGLHNVRAVAMSSPAAFRFTHVQSRMHLTLQKSVMPYQTIASNLKSKWSTIKTMHMTVRPHPLNASTQQTGRTQLDNMFRGKTAAEVQQVKQNLLNQARSKYGSNPRVMAQIQQNLDSYVRAHVVPVAPASGRGVSSTNPYQKQMLNPQPLPPRQGTQIR